MRQQLTKRLTIWLSVYNGPLQIRGHRPITKYA